MCSETAIEGSVAGLVMLQRAPGRSSSCALAWRFTGDQSYDGASTLAQDASSGVARRTAQHLSPEPHQKKGFLSPMKRPSLDDDALAIFDAEGSSGDARVALQPRRCHRKLLVGGRIYGPIKVEEHRECCCMCGSEDEATTPSVPWCAASTATAARRRRSNARRGSARSMRRRGRATRCVV